MHGVLRITSIAERILIFLFFDFHRLTDEEALAAPTTSDQNGDTKMNESTDADKEKKEENKEKPKKPQPVLGDGLIPLTPETVLIPSRPNRIIIDSIPSHIAYSQLHEVRTRDLVFSPSLSAFTDHAVLCDRSSPR